MNSKITRKPTIIILGPTGAGKSTILNYFLGYEGFKAGSNYGGDGVSTEFVIKEGKCYDNEIIACDSPGPGCEK